MTRSIRDVSRQTSQELLSSGQKGFFGIALVVAIILGILWPLLAQLLVWAMVLFFAVFVGLKMVLWYASTKHVFPSLQLPSQYDLDLPFYTILVPLFKEATALPGLLRGLEDLNYPKDKMEVLLLLESASRDPETNQQAWNLNAPNYVKLVEVPDVLPYGKQKALNIGLKVALGDHVVVYDAEDRPEPNQLLKAVGRFRVADRMVGCLQARLAFSNEASSWVSRMLWVEYIIHFEWVLKGLDKLNLLIPLGGTSNHFRREALVAIAFAHEELPEGAEGIGAWDPWNVTEDAELAGALALRGYRIELLDTVTYEVATTKVGIAIPQRSRWNKGYIQTGLSYLRNPVQMIRRLGFVRWFVYVLFMIGTPLSIVLSTLSWILTVMYFVSRSLFPSISQQIEQLFPWPLLYLGAVLLVFGNFALFMQYVIASHKRDGYTTVKWTLLLPVWQQLATVSVVRAISELARKSKRHFWAKTAHEHDLETLETGSQVSSNYDAITDRFSAVQQGPVGQAERTRDADPA